MGDKIKSIKALLKRLYDIDKYNLVYGFTDFSGGGTLNMYIDLDLARATEAHEDYDAEYFDFVFNKLRDYFITCCKYLSIKKYYKSIDVRYQLNSHIYDEELSTLNKFIKNEVVDEGDSIYTFIYWLPNIVNEDEVSVNISQLFLEVSMESPDHAKGDQYVSDVINHMYKNKDKYPLLLSLDEVADWDYED